MYTFNGVAASTGIAIKKICHSTVPARRHILIGLKFLYHRLGSAPNSLHCFSSLNKPYLRYSLIKSFMPCSISPSGSEYSFLASAIASSWDLGS